MIGSRGTFTQRLRVPLGFLCGIIMLLAARPTVTTLAIGTAIALLGLGLRAWSAGHIRKNSEVTISGPYAYTRNPLYLGSLLLGTGFLVAAAQPILIALFVLLFAGIYLPVMRVEARELTESFGENYKSYAAAVPLLAPRLTPYKCASKTDVLKADSKVKFDGSLYMRYREYQAALGTLLALAILAAKMIFFP